MAYYGSGPTNYHTTTTTYKFTTNANLKAGDGGYHNTPASGHYTHTIHTSGGQQFGKFKDPRIALRNARDNKVNLPDDYGKSAFKSVPATRGGGLASSDLSYDQLKVKLLQEGKHFEDPEFPAIDRSLYYSQPCSRRVEWKRPHEICSNPEFITGGASRFDVCQGELGDCWLLAAVACLSMQPKLFDQVVSTEQNFTSNYCGLFRFRFWHFGEWKEVVVDDRLPTVRGSLLYIHSKEKNEFWSALLEKAYAKLSGSYESLKGGSTSEALEDFTGGITEMFELKEKTPENLLQIMLKSQERCSLMACSINADPRQLEAELSNGLIMGHAYSITSVKMLDLSTPGRSGKVPLVRVRNPWGNEAEWKGAWSDNSREWSMISNDVRMQVGLTIDDDGEFWMSYQDFVSNFEKLEICHLGPQSLSGEGTVTGRKWEMCVENGGWKPRVSAGGCRNFLNTFWTNPQYQVTVIDPDEDDDDNEGTLIVGLMQKNRRRLRKEGQDLLTIGYAIYEIRDGSKGMLDMNFFKFNASKARAPAFVNLREVCGRHKLKPGQYAIIPSTFNPNEEGDFMLRIFSEKAQTTQELDEEVGLGDVTDEARPDTNTIALDEQQVAALKSAFVKIAGEDGEIDCEELCDILNETFTRGTEAQYYSFGKFQVEACRSMVAMMDFDRSGMLNFPEFKKLWELLRVWKTAFKRFDADKSGSMNSIELRNALKAVGFSINNSMFSTLVMRYAKRDGSVKFDDYVTCCARLRTLFELYNANPKTQDGKVIFDETSFVNNVIYM